MGRLALKRPTSDTQRRRSLELVHEKMSALEHKIRVLTRLRGVLYETETETETGSHSAAALLSRVLAPEDEFDEGLIASAS